MPSRPEDPTEAIPQVPDDTARMPSATEAPGSPPEVQAPETVASTTEAAPGSDAPMWAAAGHAPHEAVSSAAAPITATPVVAPPGVVTTMGAAPAPTASKTSWWKGRMALAAGALVVGLGLGAAVGATAAVAIDRGDQVTQVGDADGDGRPPGGRHGDGQLPDGQGQLPGGGQGQLPGGGTSTDPGDANGTDQAT